MRDALKGLRRKITTTKTGESRISRGLKNVGKGVGKGLRKAPGAGIKLAKNLGKRLKKRSS